MFHHSVFCARLECLDRIKQKTITLLLVASPLSKQH